uniref:Uncharacterized protein n=1 Tax=Monopterus albus TaxID=43700 RepID=A0A3Q3IPX3_MONAL
MANRRTRGMTGSDLSKTTVAIAKQLHHECSILLELYRKRESFTEDVTDTRLVSVPPPSSQLDTRDGLWCLHSALLQCRSLLERAIAKEDEELGQEMKGEYETQRNTVKERLSILLTHTGELLKAVDSKAILTPSSLELDDPTVVFELKLWIYRIFTEVGYWAKTAITTLQGLPSVMAKERARTMRVRSMRRTRR